MRKILTVALAGVLAATMLFAGCSKKEEAAIPEKIIVGTNAEFPHLNMLMIIKRSMVLILQ